MIHDLKAGILPHGLDLADHLVDIALLDELRGQVCIDDDRGVSLLHGDEAGLLLHVDQKVILCELDFRAGIVKLQHAVLLELVHGGIAVEGCEGLPDEAQVLSVLRAHGAQLRLEGVGGKAPDIVRELHIFHVQLVLDDLYEVLRQLCGRLDIHLGDGLTGL